MRNLEFPYTAHIAQIDALWKSYPRPSEAPAENMVLERWIYRGAVAPAFFNPEALLFVGINPSFPAGAKEHEGVQTYSLSYQGDDHPYFQAFGKLLEGSINDGVRDKWQTLDLLFLRQTEQSEADSALWRKETRNFIVKQLAISADILEAIRPKVIVVANTLARLLLGFQMNVGLTDVTKRHIWMGYHFEFNEELGTHVIQGRKDQDGTSTPTTLENTPVFFTSMLSGRSALDIGSRERLMWHIRRAWNYRTQKENPTATNQLPKE